MLQGQFSGLEQYALFVFLFASMEGLEGRVPTCHPHPGTEACGVSTVWSQFLCQGRENSELYASFYKLLLSTGNTGIAARGAHTWSLVLEECSTKQSVICCSTNILFFSY